MVERTLPKPDTRVRFPSAALPEPLTEWRGVFILGWMWWLGSVGRVEAVCSLLLQGTRPRSASDTLMSRRNIPASPLPLFPSPGRWSSGCGSSAGANHGLLGLGRVCAERGKEYSGWVPQTAYRGKQIGIWVPRWFRRDVGALTCRLAVKGLIEKGLAVAPCARYTLPSLLQGHPPSLRFGHPDVASGRYRRLRKTRLHPLLPNRKVQAPPVLDLRQYKGTTLSSLG